MIYLNEKVNCGLNKCEMEELWNHQDSSKSWPCGQNRATDQETLWSGRSKNPAVTQQKFSAEVEKPDGRTTIPKALHEAFIEKWLDRRHFG